MAPKPSKPAKTPEAKATAAAKAPKPKKAEVEADTAPYGNDVSPYRVVDVPSDKVVGKDN